MSYAILFDATRCSGCERCVDACVKENNGDPVAADADGAVTADGLSANRLSTVLPLGPERFVRKSCMHCVEPSCVAACLVGGLRKTVEGPVLYDPDKCIGCRYCMLACPFHVPRYQWDRTTPFVRKCSMCFHRIEQGRRPACIEACPNNALAFGHRDEMLELARELIRRNPDRYIERVWGEKEWGGTSVLAVSDIDLSPAGWPEGETEAIPLRTDPLIHKTPAIGLTVGIGTWALGAIIRRRQKLMGDES
jgi:formate dehydrogenase iron-sulfur subunit